jgi:glucose-6-phosphate 1-epimerase
MIRSPQTPQVERLELGELVCWRVRSASAELLVAQQGAQVLSYQRDGEQPLIWLSEQAAFQQGQGVRGGVPVCWPWFGDLTRNPAAVRAMRKAETPAPAHGEVRNQDWQLLGIDDAGEAVTLEFAFAAPDGGLPGWPHAVQPTLRIRLAERLTLSLTNHNHGDAPVALSQALHTYFAIGDIHQASMDGLAGCRYVDSLRDWREFKQDDVLGFSGETDRLYLDVPSQLSIRDPQWQRRIQLQTSGSRSAIVWNPWIDKSRRLSQFAEDAWQRMLCIETANVLDDALQLAPGASHTLEVTLWSEPLAE